ncbi:bacterioferritin (cytochrome b1) [Rivularia sp. PCC 7116]|uniref:ferritin-like domain-containing protein n=1 Tax=Rivularia sp. PCC 7116 TaxID=373994 RepID=UPI00029F2521|nr:ferritin-like domain-containing protein [Rivularia sp. PCC 7116]AFY53793.1 bacterioferritin (cytochrome b1) [Rivularia sp. PCC 7116]
MMQFNRDKTINFLQQILEFELAGVVRYTTYSLMVNNSEKNEIVDFLREQAEESLFHSQKVGEALVSINGNPQPRITPIAELESYSVKDILNASLAHEKQALGLYEKLLDTLKGSNSDIEKFVTNMIHEEGHHAQELAEMIDGLNSEQ